MSSYLQKASSTADATSYTFSNQNVGTAAYDRYIVVGVVARKPGSAGTDPTVTVEGVAAVKHAPCWRHYGSAPQDTSTFTGFYLAPLPAGTDADIVVSFGSTTMGECAVTLWRLTGGTVIVTDTDTGPENDPDVTIDVPANGSAFAIAATGVNTTVAWTGLTEREDSTVGTSMTVSAASDDFVSASSGRYVKADFSSFLASAGSFIAVKYCPAKSAVFDGTDYMGLASDQAGGPHNSKTGLVSLWFRWDDGTGERMLLCSSSYTTARFEVKFQKTTDIFSIRARNSAGQTILDLTSAWSWDQGRLYHVLASWDLAAEVAHLYINDQTNAQVNCIEDDTIDYSPSTTPYWMMGIHPAGTCALKGAQAELWFDPATYLDLSVEANRRKFISAAKGRVSLGDDGSLPTGTAPRMYHRVKGSDPAELATNYGTGSDMSITGTLALADGPPA